MNCEQRRDLMLLYALGDLDGEERQDLSEHLAGGCPSCTGALREAEATVGLIPLGLKPVAPPPAVKDRLLAEIAQEASVASTPCATARSTFVKAAPWIALIVPWLLAATMAVLWWQCRQDLDQLRQTVERPR